MLKRTYPIRLRPDASQESIKRLHAVLSAAPEHIPGLLVSELFAERPGGSHDLVWENVFEDEDAFWLYAGHPYHANLINEYLAPDSPRSVKAESSIGITWSTSEPFDAEEFFGRWQDPSDAGGPAELSGLDPALERAGIEVPIVFLIEQIEVAPGKVAEYLDAVREIYLPAASRHRMRLLMSWQTPPETGEEELTFLWSVAGWAEALRSFVSISHEADVMQRWLDTVRPLRRGGRRRYLLPTDLPGHWATQG